MKKVIEKWNQISLIKRIICGLILGLILGLTIPQVTVISMLGDIFVGALKAIAPVLVFFLVMSALSGQHIGQRTNMSTIIILYLLGTFLAGAVAVIADGDGVLGCGGVGYRNRQLLLIVAHAVEGSNGKLGGLFRSGCAADLAGGLFQRQAIGQLATEKFPQNEASPSCLKLMVVRRADRAAGQRRGSNRRRILRT